MLLDVKKPIITLGVCVRNSASTIREAIESIIAQDFPPELLELVVVDGHSEDETLSIVERSLENSVMKVRIFSEYKGLGYARQKVVDNAEGKYIIWVDGDMVISRNYVSTLFNFMENHAEMGIVKGRQALEPGGNLLATLEAYSRIASKMVDYSSKKAFVKALGTSGCIYRTEAIKQAGGFDENLKGYCEDWDAEIKVRACGWSLSTIAARYLDYERHRLTWKNLWRRYWLRGYHTHYFLHKNRGLIKHHRMIPPVSFMAGFLRARTLFKLTRRKLVFLLPLQYLFKMTAWYVGFANSHFSSYEFG